MEEHTVVGIDIGTTKICTLVARDRRRAWAAHPRRGHRTFPGHSKRDCRGYCQRHAGRLPFDRESRAHFRL